MKNALSNLVLPVVLSCAPLALVAQTTPTTPQPHKGYVQMLTAKLGLSAEQQAQATTIFANARASEATVHASLKTAHQGLSDAIKANNTVSIEQLSATIGTLSAQSSQIHSKAQAAFYQILTPEQRTTFDQLQSQHSARFGNGARPAWRGNNQ